MLSDQFLMAKFNFLLIFDHILLIFVFPYCGRFLARVSEWLLEWGETKWNPGGDFTGPEGSQCFLGGPLACS